MSDASPNSAAMFRHGERLIARAAVIGAGSMGAGIAAQFANSGIPVTLLDLPSGGEDPAAIARGGVARQLKAGGFMRPDVASLISVGTTDELHLLAEADLIIEAVSERLDVKQDLFHRIEKQRKEGSIVASNTSTLPRRAMADGLPERFSRDFVILHFFNPPRHMDLVELVGGEEVSAETLDRAAKVCEVELGKTVVAARDTPGFIANRIGCYWMVIAALEAIAADLEVEAADAILAALTGAPRTGVFGLFDLIGIDVMPHILGSLYNALPPDDPLHAVDLRRWAVFEDMLKNRRFGRKTQGGFYRLAADGSKEVWNYNECKYRPVLRLPKYEAQLLDGPSPAGRYARRVLARTIAYATGVADQIAESPEAIDAAMTLGYAWTEGPFALATRLGEKRVVSWLRNTALPVPPRLTATARSSAASTKASPYSVLIESDDAGLLDLGDGIAGLEIRTKMNVFTEAVLATVDRALETIPGRFKALVLTGAGRRAYSAGADLKRIREWAEVGDWDAIGAFIRTGQVTFRALKRAPFPVVSAAFGAALGGGCESLLHADAVIAHAELNVGLPEAKVGIVPAWGGCTLLLERALAEGMSLEDAAFRVFDAVLAGRISTSALDAAGFGVLTTCDKIVMSRSRLLNDAKTVALSLAQGYQPRASLILPAGGGTLRERLESRMASRPDLSEHDRVIGTYLARILSGGNAKGEIAEADMLELEREAFLALIRTPKTRARIDHMLATGKPLRN